MITLIWPRKQVVIFTHYGHCSVSQKIPYLDIMRWILLCNSVYWFCLHSVLGEKALADAGIPYSSIEQACVGYVYGETF